MDRFIDLSLLSLLSSRFLSLSIHGGCQHSATTCAHRISYAHEQRFDFLLRVHLRCLSLSIMVSTRVASLSMPSRDLVVALEIVGATDAEGLAGLKNLNVHF